MWQLYVSVARIPHFCASTQSAESNTAASLAWKYTSIELFFFRSIHTIDPMALSLPHISRLFTAKILQRVSYVSILAVLLFSLIYLYITNVFLAMPYGPNRISGKILSNPLDAQGHIILAEYYKDSANDAKKAREVAIAQELSNNSPTILGSSTDIPSIIQTWKMEPEQYEEKLEYWQHIIETHPEYRDAYVQAAFYASKLKLTTLAETLLLKAKELDPLH